MSTSPEIWGIHLGYAEDEDPISGEFIAIGWDALPDLSSLKKNRDAYKLQFKASYPEEKDGAVPVKAGVNYRFVVEMGVGDYVIYPSKADRVVHVGKITSEYYHQASGRFQHRRRVEWLKSAPRAAFSQPALNEIGSAITLFKISNNFDEFESFLSGNEYAPAAIEAIDEDSIPETALVTEQETRDYIVKKLHHELTPEQFEYFVRDLMVSMGYFARVTKTNSQRSGDGGVDIIASRDELGFEPPVIKVECKRVIDGKMSRPDVQKLLGTLEGTEVGLFVTLNGFTTEARILERSKPNLRLIDGDNLADLIMHHYEKLEATHKNLIRLRRVLIPV